LRGEKAKKKSALSTGEKPTYIKGGKAGNKKKVVCVSQWPLGDPTKEKQGTRTYNFNSIAILKPKGKEQKGEQGGHQCSRRYGGKTMYFE